ncbi:MAG: hypothetical protein JST07_05595 [Bacteroidetes bacterium]|nr:hypothetical protein [Bacteroidota bacterium]
MNHFASSSFWHSYQQLPNEIKELADKNFKLLKENPSHPSLHFKKINDYFSVRVGIKYRALGITVVGGILWFWIGNHTAYDKMLKE